MAKGCREQGGSDLCKEVAMPRLVFPVSWLAGRAGSQALLPATGPAHPHRAKGAFRGALWGLCDPSSCLPSCLEPLLLTPSPQRPPRPAPWQPATL